MYVWIWRHLPGPLAAKLAQTILLLLVVIAVLLFLVFPAIESYVPINQVTVPKK